MKTSRVVAGLVITGIGIGYLLNAYLPDFGSGWSLGGAGENSDAAKSTPEAETEKTSEQPIGAPIQEPIASADQLGPVKMVYIMIDGRDYLVRRGPEGKAAFRPAELDEVIKVAEQATGDDNGIRVRVEQKSSARDTAERALRAELDKAGISGDAVLWREKPVDSQQ